MDAPIFDDAPCFLEALEDTSIEANMPELAVEWFTEPTLSW
jgi:hypothetical protein